MKPSTHHSPQERLKRYRRGEAPTPKWEYIDSAYGVETELHFAEEISHPENRPLLCLYNMDEGGDVLGEVWFAPADLPAIIDFLQWQLAHNYTSGQRRWLGNDQGPALYLGEADAEREP